MHRRPPRSALGTPGALGSVDISDDAILEAESWGEIQTDGLPSGEISVHASTVDLQDSFYQLKNRRLADWFGCEWAETASAWGITSFVNADGVEEKVEPIEMLFFVFEGMPMGWSWALYFCQSAMCDACSDAVPTDEFGRG
eukprot:11501599-Karenia_brevis.AAC.1